MAWLEIEGLHRSFGARAVLRGVDLAIERGEHALILGPSGSGKSTLLHLLARLLEPDAGAIRLEGQPITARGDAAAFRRTHIGIVFQEFHLLDALTPRQNLQLVGDACPPGPELPTPEALLDPLGLLDRIDSPVHELSRGERQRVALARAFANRPQLILADEPTASLDPDNRARSMALFFDLCDRMEATALVVSHDPALNAAKAFHSVQLLDHGVLAEAAP